MATKTPSKALRGVQCPLGEKKDRSSTDAGRVALAASTRLADVEAAERILTERNWRQGYNSHLVRNCALLAEGPEERTVALAATGLKALHEAFEFIAEGGAVESLASAMERVPDLVAGHGGFGSAMVRGALAGEAPGPLRVPYKGTLLEGGALQAQLQEWLHRGIIQEDACGALGAIAQQTAVDLAGQHFVVMGAGSEMCPMATLLEQGATVYALDLARPQLWHRLVRVAQASRGTLVAPMRGGGAGSGAPQMQVLGEDLSEDAFCEAAGCNLLEETPQVAAWICAQGQGQRLCVGSYVYLDGANFVRVALAADAVLQAVCTARPDTALSCLSSPTECYAVPEACFEEGARRLAEPPAGQLHRLWYTPVRLASKGRYLSPVKPSATVPMATGRPLLIRDDYVWLQGPNYAFAKHIQRWRMLLARSQGHTTSVNVGPMTLTRSVLSNSLIAAGAKGATHFGVEPFYASTSSALLGALLVHDLTCKASAANPDVPQSSPLLLFSENALHVGTWNAAFQTNSFTEVCALTFVAGKAQPYVAAAAACVACAMGCRLGRSKL